MCKNAGVCASVRVRVRVALFPSGAGSPRLQAQQLHLSDAPLQMQVWAHLAQPTGQQEQQPGEDRAEGGVRADITLTLPSHSRPGTSSSL